MLSTALCSNCEGAGLELQVDGRVVCRYCGAPNLLDAVICPHCEQVNAAQDESCSNCRQSLQRACPDCGQRNWSGLDRCGQCGRHLDAVALLSTRWGTDPATRLNELRDGVAHIKQLEERGSQRRMAELDGLEARRRSAQAAGQENKAARRRRLMLWVAVSSAGFCLLVAAAILIANFR